MPPIDPTRFLEHKSTDLLREVRRADPNYDRESIRVDGVYQFSHRNFGYEITAQWGPYTPLPYTPVFAAGAIPPAYD